MARVIGCDEHVRRSCAAHSSGTASAHPFARSIQLGVSLDPIVGWCRSHQVTFFLNVRSPATVVLLQRATHRPPPRAKRPSSMCPARCGLGGRWMHVDVHGGTTGQSHTPSPNCMAPARSQSNPVYLQVSTGCYCCCLPRWILTWLRTWTWHPHGVCPCGNTLAAAPVM